MIGYDAGARPVARPVNMEHPLLLTRAARYSNMNSTSWLIAHSFCTTA